MMTITAQNVFLALLFFCFMILHRATVQGQGCSNACPPLNGSGVPIPSLCPEDTILQGALSKSYNICHPRNYPGVPSSFKFSDFQIPGHITVISNYYIGCDAGRRESGVFAHVAQRYWNDHKDKVTFISSLKGGGTCQDWASIYQNDAKDLYRGSNVVPKEMPLAVDDSDYSLRDLFFTAPFGHPSYIILDGNLKMRHKFIGPCCGYETYASCTSDIAKTLDVQLSQAIDNLLTEEKTGQPTPSPTLHNSRFLTEECEVQSWSAWSECSISCKNFGEGIQFRWRVVRDNRQQTDPEKSPSPCPTAVETRPCQSAQICLVDPVCVPEYGQSYTIRTIANGFSKPRDVAFHPSPGLHLGNYSEGRAFITKPYSQGEAWVLNSGNHSVSIVTSIGTNSQTTISRRDRGYYHYMPEASALSFNSVSNSGRAADKDSFNYWAVCNDNSNTYLDTKEPNYFMGPTLYNSSPDNRNTVNRLGRQCRKEEPCFFLHSDMLHEAPNCIGIVHDPEVNTAYGNVYWAFDSTGNRQNGQLVRFDFQQPHGPGSMDHSVASVRRYPEVILNRGSDSIHAGMVVHSARREVYIVNPGDGTVLVVGADSGKFARTARMEYPIYSSPLPSFEYSVWECVDQKVFASGLDLPSGLALSADGNRLFVAEQKTGRINVYEISSGSLLNTITTPFNSIGGMAISPRAQRLFFVDTDTNSLNSINPESVCTSAFESRLSPVFKVSLEKATSFLEEEVGPGTLSLYRDYQCVVDATVPDSSFFEQVHTDSGYAATDYVMNQNAALLASRTDCEATSDLNFDDLLLGGYFCHQCLPNNGSMCDTGGVCLNIQWQGYICDNEFIVETETQTGLLTLLSPNSASINVASLQLKPDVTYRFIVIGDMKVSIHDSDEANAEALSLPGNECGCASMGQFVVTPSDFDPIPSALFLRSFTGDIIRLGVDDVPVPTSQGSRVNLCFTCLGIIASAFQYFQLYLS